MQRLQGSLLRLGGAVLLATAVPSWTLGQAPPQDLKKVGDHWTAWSPPAEVQEGSEVHIIERGDTLWGLAGRFLGDSYLWPQLWEQNRYIEDSHWIYPGDPIVVSFSVESTEVLGDPDMSSEEALASAVDRTIPRRQSWFGAAEFQPLGSPDDIQCSGFIGGPEEAFAYRIIGSEYDFLAPSLELDRSKGALRASFGNRSASKIGLSTGDIIYVDGGLSAGLTPGDIYTAVEPGRIVHHPISGDAVGFMYHYQGQVRLLSVQEDSAIAEVSKSCDGLTVGSGLLPFQRDPIPSERRTPMRPLNDPVPGEELVGAPTIVDSKGGIVALAADHVVFVDVGESEDVIPGDIYTIYRETADSTPPVLLGELAILAVHETTSVARILESRYPIYLGDKLALK